MVRAYATEKELIPDGGLDGFDGLVDEPTHDCIHCDAKYTLRTSSTDLQSGLGGSPVIEISSQMPTYVVSDLCHSECTLDMQQSPIGNGLENHKKTAERQPSKQWSSNAYSVASSSKNAFKSLGCSISDATRTIKERLGSTSSSISRMNSANTNCELVNAASQSIQTMPSVTRTCSFEGVKAGNVEVFSAPVKTIDRMREKVFEYATESNGGGWPLCANILDPVRSSVVCSGPAQILEVFKWFAGSNPSMMSDFQEVAQSRGTVRLMPFSRVKNKFAFPKEELLGG